MRIRDDLLDRPDSFGWISIALHWIAAVILIALWFIGRGIYSGSVEDVEARRALHVSIGATTWLLLVLRLLWRLKSRHPHVSGQSALTHMLAKSTHYTMLVALLVMLVSGPVMVWALASPIAMFGLFNLPSAESYVHSAATIARFAHERTATILAVLVVVHLGGFLKHLMFHSDDTVVRMLWPKKK